MWVQPRRTLRTLLQLKPTYGLLWLVTVYALQRALFFAHYWSLGLTLPLYVILPLSLVLSPFLGLAWLYTCGWILHATGHWFQGKASAATLRTAYAWSKIPAEISLLMWVILILLYPSDAFIPDGHGPSSSLVHSVSSILSVWSFVLLVQLVREVQHFSLLRALANSLIAWFLSVLTFLLAAALLLYIYSLIP
jgi:hypothetical protein